MKGEKKVKKSQLRILTLLAIVSTVCTCISICSAGILLAGTPTEVISTPTRMFGAAWTPRPPTATVEQTSTVTPTSTVEQIQIVPLPTQTTSLSIPTVKVCCKWCKKGKACGDSCIPRDKVCNEGPGCACDQ